MILEIVIQTSWRRTKDHPISVNFKNLNHIEELLKWDQFLHC